MRYLENYSNWCLILEKSELKYSNSAFDQISKLLNEFKKKKNILKSDEKVYKEMGFDDGIKIKIPYNEICYDSKKIKIGLFILGIELSSKVDNDYTFTEKQIINYKEVFKDIKEGKSNKLFDDISEKVLNEGFEVIKLTISDSLASQGLASWYNKELSLSQDLISRLFVSGSKMESTIRHELQHFTQFINGYLLSLGNEFSKRINQLIESDEERFRDLFKSLVKVGYVKSVFSKKNTGTSKTKSGLVQDIGQDEGFWKNLNKQLAFEITTLTGIATKAAKDYYGDDLEYHTWISDTIDDYTKKYKDYIKKNDISNATNFIFNKIKKTAQFKINFKLKKETSKDYYLYLRNRIEKIKKEK